jgi:putative secretion ATPase (PEP-CTERM system associated)
MYEKHFSFKYKPFELVPNPDFFFLSSTHKKAITYLDYGIKERAGFILLTGEIGSGKTTIIRNLIKDLGSSIKLSRVNNTMVSSEELISVINEDFGLEIDGKSKTRLISELNEFLIEQYSRKIQPILLIDEAQNLSADLLEEIRLLSNLETDRSKLLQIILVGQPELKKTLMLPGLIQLRQRISINYHITPLSIDETGQYIKHRLTVAGNPDAIKIDGDMLHIIYQFSRGIPRLINILCDFVLLSAFVEGANEVTVDVVREVAKDLESHEYWNEGNDSEILGQEKNDINADLSTEIANISRRLLRFEEVIEKSPPDIDVLKEKIDLLDKKVSEMVNALENKNGDTTIERIEKFENDNSGSSDEKDNERPFIERVDFIKGALGDINKKLKKL